MDLNKLFDCALEDYKKNGYIGMDFNMAVMCICSKRLNKKFNFMVGKNDIPYDEKIEYWAGKRNFGHLQVNSEDDLLKHAEKEYLTSKS